MGNVLNLLTDSGFWDAIGIVAVVAGCVLSVLYFDRYKRWSATRAERLKMKQWTRSKS